MHAGVSLLVGQLMTLVQSQLTAEAIIGQVFLTSAWFGLFLPHFPVLQKSPKLASCVPARERCGARTSYCVPPPNSG